MPVQRTGDTVACPVDVNHFPGLCDSVHRGEEYFGSEAVARGRVETFSLAAMHRVVDVVVLGETVKHSKREERFRIAEAYRIAVDLPVEIFGSFFARFKAGNFVPLSTKCFGGFLNVSHVHPSIIQSA